MIDRGKAIPGELVVSSGPLALTKRVAGKVKWYAVGLVAILVALGIVFRHSLSWGDVATWVLAITTLLAFVAAAFAGLVAYDLLRVEHARDTAAAGERLLADADRQRAEDERAARREADRRAQASKVTAWFHSFEIVKQVVPPVYEKDARLFEARRVIKPAETIMGFTWGAAVRNASELPILDVRVLFYWVNDPGDGSPWTTELRYASPYKRRVTPPGQTWNYELPEDIRSMAEECSTQVYLVAIEFTDNNGTRWIRNERGLLIDPGNAT